MGRSLQNRFDVENDEIYGSNRGGFGCYGILWCMGAIRSESRENSLPRLTVERHVSFTSTCHAVLNVE